MAVAEEQFRRFITPAYWHVVFVARDRKYWFDWFTKPHCRHVFAYAYLVDLDLWAIVDPTQDRTCINLLSNDDLDAYTAQFGAENLTRYVVKVGEGSFSSGRVLQSCSNIILRIVGLPGSASTPQALERILIRHNAELRT